MLKLYAKRFWEQLPLSFKQHLTNIPPGLLKKHLALQ